MKKNTTCPNCKCDEIYESGPKTMTCEVCGESWKKENGIRDFVATSSVDEEFMQENYLEEEEEGSYEEPFDTGRYDEENFGYDD